MPRTLLLLAILACASATDHPKPDVPDPYGLGERLALIDWLREHGAPPPPDATDEQLVELYWAKQAPKPEIPEDFDQALTRDRVNRLRRQLSERGVTAPADADEDRLRRIFADAKEAAVGKDSAKTVDRGEQRGPSDADRRRAENALGDLGARLERTAGESRQTQVDANTANERLKRMADSMRSAKTALDQAAATVAQCQGDADKAEAQFKQESMNSQTPPEGTRKLRASAQSNLAATQATYQDRMAEMQRLADEATSLARKRDQALAELQRLTAHQNELEQQTVAAQAEANTGLAKPDLPAPADKLASVDDVVAAMRAAVVLVVVEGCGTGSGFFISHDGYCLTNAHVVGDGSKPVTALWDPTGGRKPVGMRVVSVCVEDDLALLHADTPDTYPALRLRERYDLARPLVAAGFPLAAVVSSTLGTSPADLVVSRGTLNAVRRRDDQQPAWLQHDCRLEHGSSGGPLIDAATGDAIGINTALLTPKPVAGQPTPEAIPLAIPAKTVFARFGAFIKP